MTLEKALIYLENEGDPIKVMFNPREYTISQQANYTTGTDTDTAPQFKGFKYQPFLLSLF